MQPERATTPRCRPRDAWLRLALLLWALALVAVAVRILLETDDWNRNVYPVFAEAAEHWQNGQDLYFLPDKSTSMALYRYSPLAAALLVPLTALPIQPASIVWRALNFALYLGAFVWWLQVVLPRPPSRNQLGVLLLLIAPLSLSCLNNGQANPLVLGLLLAAVAAAGRQRWPLASLCCMLAFSFKLYPLALGMLLAAVHPRRFLHWLVLGLLAGLALPFALQSWDYVLCQYQDWIRYLNWDDRNTMELGDANRDFRLFLRVWVFEPSNATYLAMQLMTAAASAALCLGARLGHWPQSRLLNLVVALGCCWMVLFGPATESNTYILLAPTLAASVMEAWLTRAFAARILLLGSFGLFLSLLVANWFPFGGRPLQALGLHPIAAGLLLVGVLYQEYHWFTTNRQSAADSSAARARAA